MRLEGHTALVTGASGGIGRCFCEELASRGADLLISGRRDQALDELAQELSGRHGVQVTPLPADLSVPGAAREIFERTEGVGRRVDLLINNAGVGSFGPFADTPLERIHGQLVLNVLALTELTRLFMRPMIERRRGYILNVASFVAYMPIPGYAAYAASKAYVRNFTEALAHEARHTPLRICCLCPGATATGFWEAAGQKQTPVLIRISMSAPDKVARVGLKALLRGRRNIVSGLLNKLVVWFTRLSPRRLMVRLAALVAGERKSR